MWMYIKDRKGSRYKMSLKWFDGPLVAQQNQCFKETLNSDYQAESTVFCSCKEIATAEFPCIQILVFIIFKILQILKPNFYLT